MELTELSQPNALEAHAVAFGLVLSVIVGLSLIVAYLWLRWTRNAVRDFEQANEQSGLHSFDDEWAIWGDKDPRDSWPELEAYKRRVEQRRKVREHNARG